MNLLSIVNVHIKNIAILYTKKTLYTCKHEEVAQVEELTKT